LDPVFVDDPQGTKPHVPGIVIGIEGEGVTAVEPVTAEMTAFFRFAQGDHVFSPYPALPQGQHAYFEIIGYPDGVAAALKSF
jgi:hypothetical protein